MASFICKLPEEIIDKIFNFIPDIKDIESLSEIKQFESILSHRFAVIDYETTGPDEFPISANFEYHPLKYNTKAWFRLHSRFFYNELNDELNDNSSGESIVEITNGNKNTSSPVYGGPYKTFEHFHQMIKNFRYIHVRVVFSFYGHKLCSFPGYDFLKDPSIHNYMKKRRSYAILRTQMKPFYRVPKLCMESEGSRITNSFRSRRPYVRDPNCVEYIGHPSCRDFSSKFSDTDEDKRRLAQMLFVNPFDVSLEYSADKKELILNVLDPVDVAWSNVSDHFYQGRGIRRTYCKRLTQSFFRDYYLFDVNEIEFKFQSRYSKSERELANVDRKSIVNQLAIDVSECDLKLRNGLLELEYDRRRIKAFKNHFDNSHLGYKLLYNIKRRTSIQFASKMIYHIENDFKFYWISTTIDQLCYKYQHHIQTIRFRNSGSVRRFRTIDGSKKTCEEYDKEIDDRIQREIEHITNRRNSMYPMVLEAINKGKKAIGEYFNNII
ncbi:hypothetical protein WICMUC_002664 [Wickerhamomyces mucosus]|uniref:Uncharacterized protein n=1 Tax=Wickerhamomyces mucosus TaxID=1378264 RepID=A0A9P8TEF3_9ASCO|nr:hypothetical protein WICMUC_002664 [Wickerhamomyces mucosus]